MAEANSNIGSASHLGENQVVRDSHFVYDYTRRRVPIPVTSYLAVADTDGPLPDGDSAGKKALDMLRDLIEPAVIAEEELNTEYMEKLIRDAFSKINAALGPKPEAEPPTPGTQVSLTMVLATANRAYIGHIGTTRLYLLHNDRLYDLVPHGSVPSGSAPPPPREDAPTLFPTAQAAPPSEEQPAQGEAQQQGEFLGESDLANIGYNEVEITPEDTLVLCTDGFWKTVSEEETVENLLAAMNVQRSANQLIRLAFSRNASDNATIAAWQYESPEESAALAGRPKARRINRTRAAEGLLVALLALVLVGIFTVGFAFGWRITDTFRKRQKLAAQKASKAKAAEEEKKREQVEAEKKRKAAQSQPAPQSTFPKTATIKGQGVRMRASPDVNSEIVGQLDAGQQVTVLDEVAGTDSMTWSRVKAAVKSGGQQKEVEGYVRNDFLEVSQ